MAIGGPGLPLPFPTVPYPIGTPGVTSQSVWSNYIYMLAGQRWQIPPGVWLISGGTQSTPEVLDPVSNLWAPIVSAARFWIINSDGTNYRLSNLNSSLVGAAVTAAGSGYVQASTTVTPTTGISTWQPIIGGAVNGTVTIGTDKSGNTGGTNFTYAPVLVVQAPPNPGVQATASCTISGGAINAVTIRAAGAGYLSPPGILIIPDPADPTLGLITVPTLTTTLTGAGTLTAVLMTNPGAPVTSAPTLTVNGVGTSATATATLFASATTADTLFVQWLGGVS